MSSDATFITETSQVTSEWLETILCAWAGNDQVKIRNVEISRELNPPFSHAACILKVDYHANPCHLPATFFFKIGRRPSEAVFHKEFASRTESPALAICYHAQSNGDLGMSNLLLEDLSASHLTLPGNLPEQETYLEKIAETLAGIQRQWWEHPDLRPGQPLVDDVMGFVWGNTRPKLAFFFELAGETLPGEYRRFYERIFASLPLPAWTERLRQHRGVTLVHGDVQLQNFLWPVDGKPDPKLVDWALWHVNLPTYDLAYILALRTAPDLRRSAERRILKHYLNTLSIPDYGWEELTVDYRFSLIQQTIWPVFFHNFTPAEVWMALVQQSMSAFIDWRCEELLP